MFFNQRLAEDIRNWIDLEGDFITRKYSGMELIPPRAEQKEDGNYIFRYETEDINADLLIWLKGEVNCTIANFPELLKTHDEIYSIADSCVNLEQVQIFAADFFKRLDEEIYRN